MNLILTVDEDRQLNDHMKQLDGGVGSASIWERIERLLLQVGQPEKAKDLYHTLVEQTSDQGDQGHYYHQQGDYAEGLPFY